MSRLWFVYILLALSACLSASTAPTRQLPSTEGPAVATEQPAADGPTDDPADLSEAIEDDSEEQIDDVDDADDAVEGTEPPPAEQPPHPFAELADEQLEKMLLEDPTKLGPLSLGRPGAGALFGGTQMQSSARWEVVNPRETWGTPETIEALTRCIDAVNDQFPDTPRIPIGDISTERGGHLVPHISHQSGRDVDVAFYYTTDDGWYTRANANNLDLPRTWAFVRAMITETDVELIFIDRSIQKILREYAASIGEDEGWLDQVFGGPSTTLRPIIRHEKGHKTHIHVRFYNPIAQQSGRRMHRMLIANKMIDPPTYYIHHKVKRGDTLIKLARRYNTSVKAIKKANRLRSNRIIANRKYKIPRRGGVIQSKEALVIPSRRLPPTTPRPSVAEAGAAPPATGGSSGSPSSAAAE